MDHELQNLKRDAKASGSMEAWERYAVALERVVGGIPELLPVTPDPKNYRAGYRCRDCGTIILSLSRHSFVVCECWRQEDPPRGCFIDGGEDYTRAGGSPDRMEPIKIKVNNLS